jgi:hypothetical protein
MSSQFLNRQYCTGVCPGYFRTLLGAIRNYCNDNDKALIGEEDLLGLTLLTRLPCIQENGRYCMSDVNNALIAFSTPPITALSLGHLCAQRDCLRALSQVLVEAGARELVETVNFVGFELMCTRYNGEFCLLRAEQFKVQFPNPDLASTLFYENLCHPCIRRLMIKRMMALSLFDTGSELELEQLRNLTGLLFYACAKDEAGQFCGPDTFGLYSNVSLMANLATCNFDSVLPAACPATCKQSASYVLDTMGCCAHQFVEGLVINRVGLFHPFATAAAVALTRAWVNNVCFPLVDPVPFQPSCTPERLRLQLIIKNLAAALGVNRTEVLNRVAQEIAALLGIGPYNVQVSGGSSPLSSHWSTMATTDATLDVTIIPDSQSDLAIMKQALTEEISNGFAMYSLGTMGTQLAVDGCSTIEGATVSCQPSAAVHVVPVVLSLVVFLAALLF